MLVGDDGLGAVIVDQLVRDFDLPEGLNVADGGTLGLALLPLLQDCGAAIFIDAVRSGDDPPGTPIRLQGDDVLPAVRQHLSVHQIGVADLLDAARLTGGYPSELVLLLLPAAAFGQARIVGMSIACSNDHVYTWYSDRTVSVGTSENLAAYEPPHRYSLPFGKTPEDIVEIGIAGNDHVFTWYRDSTVSSGTSTDLDKYQPRHPYRLPPGKLPFNIVGIDIACSNDHVYAWYSEGTVSSGTSDDLDKYGTLHLYHPASLFTPQSILGIGIAGNDHVYAWYISGKVSSGTSENLDKYRRSYDFVRGPGPCDISADPPKLNGRSVFGVGIRGPECKSSAEIVVRIRTDEPNVPRRIFIEKRLSGTNFELPVTYSCTGTGERTILTEVQTQGRTVRSAKTTIGGCF